MCTRAPGQGATGRRTAAALLASSGCEVSGMWPFDECTYRYRLTGCHRSRCLTGLFDGSGHADGEQARSRTACQCLEDVYAAGLSIDSGECCRFFELGVFNDGADLCFVVGISRGHRELLRRYEPRGWLARCLARRRLPSGWRTQRTYLALYIVSHSTNILWQPGTLPATRRQDAAVQQHVELLASTSTCVSRHRLTAIGGHLPWAHCGVVEAAAHSRRSLAST